MGDGEGGDAPGWTGWGWTPTTWPMLEGAEGSDFESMWLEMMIEHHEGAVEMAEEQQKDGLFADAVALAESIESSQSAEIELMEDLLGQ